MLNYIWLFLIIVSIVVAAVNGRLDETTKAALDSASSAVEISFGMIGIMALWLGIMKIAEEGGLIEILSKILRPLARFLFPNIPKDHPVIGLMLMNLIASWLGLGNAATPLGLKAMESLQRLNKKKDTATNAMVVFLALNTASICIIPMTIIAIRNELGSLRPYEIIGATFLSSLCATIAAVIAAKSFERLKIFKENDPDLLE
ncbi:MAG: nucleoside recognition protein [Candidatus Marinimicrobia bacterium]|nr:nucleoside recognition protein [Candidatus Neomarinimicrobiota bacterium]